MPSAAMEVLLAALVRGDQVEWPFTGTAAEQHFLDAAQRHGVVPLVAWQHRRRGSLNDWPAALRSAIAARARQHAIVEQLQRSELTAVVGELTSRSVRSIVLKGAALAYTHYPHPCLRPREDFDLLVHESQKERRGRCVAGSRVLAARDGDRPARHLSADVRPGCRPGCASYVRSSLARVESSGVFTPSSLGDVSRRMPARFPLSTLSVEGLAPPHALLLACLHRVAHHFDPPTLIWLYDIHLLASSMSEDDAARFVALAVDSGLAAICARGIARAQHHFRTPLPAAFEDLAPAGDEPLAAYHAQGVSALRRAHVGPACAARVSRSLPVVARTPLSTVSIPARGPAAPGLGSAALAVRAPDRSGRRHAGFRQRESHSRTRKEADVMPLTAGSNHGASRTDSDLFVGLTRELLQRGCNVRFRATGTSMHPTIRDGEVVTVAPSSGDAFAVGDVLLCRFGRRPTAHRVVAVQPSPHGRPVLHLHGDNLCSRDGPVRAEDVIGRVLTVSRDGSEHPLDGPGRLVRLRRIARWLFAASVVWATVMGASEASAQIGQTLTWVGGNGPNWSTRQNWIPEEIPSRGDNLVFPASLFRITTNDLVDLSVEAITISDNYTIGGLALEITGDAGLLLESAVTVTVALNLALSREPTNIAVADGGTLELSGRVTARNFVKQGAGTLVLSGANDDITDLIGEDGCGVIRATNPLALGVSLVGRIELGQNCTLQVEANTMLDKPIIVNGMGAPGTTGALVIAAGVTLTERLELRLDSPAKISVLSGATLDLPQSQVGLTMNLNSPLTVNVAALGVAGISRVIAGTGGLIKEGAGSLFLDKNNTYNGQTTIKGGTVLIDGDQPDSPVVLDGGTVAGGERRL